MYSVSSYGKMIADGPRVNAYVEALRGAVKPGSVVIDIGSGPGFFALLACQLGARRVYAIEPDAVIELARASAEANNFSDRLVCLQDLSMQTQIKEQADVIVSDLRGILPFFQQHLPSICDARKRWLKPGGTLIPRRDFLWAALVSAPEKYEDLTAIWKRDRLGLDLTAGRPFVVNSWTTMRPAPEQLIVEPIMWHTIDYNEVTSPDVEANIHWQIKNPQTTHGLLIWFDTELADGIGFSNHPAEPELIYGSAFFPLQEPITLSAGDVVGLTLQADLVGEDYIWRWNTRVSSGDREPPRVNFKQSSFFSAPLSLQTLHKQAGSFVPTASEEGRMIACALALMDGSYTVEQIALEVAGRFPQRFKNSNDALSTVSLLSKKYSNG